MAVNGELRGVKTKPRRLRSKDSPFGMWAGFGGGHRDLMTVSRGKIGVARLNPDVLIVDAAVTDWVKPHTPKINFYATQLVWDPIGSPHIG